MTAVDERTVEIKLAAPDGAFLVNFCGFSGLGILPKHILGEVAPESLKENPFSLEPNVTAGGYNFVQYQTDQYLEMERSETYPGDGGARSHLHADPDAGSRARAARDRRDRSDGGAGGERRACQRSGRRDRRLRAKPEHGLPGLNLDRPFLQNQMARQAMMHAIDREGIVDSVLHGEGTVVNSSIFGPDWMGVPEGLESLRIRSGQGDGDAR